MSVVSFLLPHIRALKNVADVHVLANTNDKSLLQEHGIDVPIEPVKLVRVISFWSDLKVLWNLYWHFKRTKPLAVHTITPKAGLLGITAAYIAGVPVRVHSFTGQVWVTRTGPMRWLLKAADKCISTMTTDALVDSPSQRNFLIQEGVLSADRSKVLGAGSICGVNTQRFFPNTNVRNSLRSKLGTSSDALVCLYLGRLNSDKGVLDLAASFALLAAKHPKAELWVVGPDEDNCFEQMKVRLVDVLSQVKRVGFTSEPEQFMQAADLFCLPSYREGFGSSVIEAAACGVPALVSRIYGLTDAVAEGQTGWMHLAGNVDDLADKLDYLLSNPDELMVKGNKARDYASNMFAEEAITQAMVQFYKRRLNETSI